MKTAIALKLDFKIDQEGILRIFDIGDGLDADITGFENIPIAAIVLRDLHQANDSAIASVFGELPIDSMQAETLHIPIIPRALSSQTWSDPSDLNASDCHSILPYGERRRTQAFASYYWNKSEKLNNLVPSAISLIGMEMHKIFWYLLMEKHMASIYQKNILYWSSDEEVAALDLKKIDMTNGVFIKIVDRSIGGGDNVYYASNAIAATKILAKLHNSERHIYVIEPAYQTIKSYNNKNYDATGRAFVTLIFDKETNELQVKVAGAKWILPLEPMKKGVQTQNQMLANVKHSTDMLPFNEEDLTLLTEQIVQIYGDILKASITHDNLMQYCNEHPIMEKFLAVLKPNALYKWAMDHPQSHTYFGSSLFSWIYQIFPITFEELTFTEKKGKSIFSSELDTKEVMKKICTLSFLERSYDIIPLNYKQDTRYTLNWITHNLNAFIKQFLTAKNEKYDTSDLGRALRQAATQGDVEILKLLIGTNRASINAVSPKTKQTALDFARQSECDASTKEKCELFLIGSGAKTAEELKVSVRPGIGK